MKKRNKIIVGILIIFLLGICAWIMPTKYEIVRNYSESLPYHFVVVKKGEVPNKKDQIFVFYVRDNPLLKVSKIKFIKLAGGLPGDTIDVRKKEIFINRNSIGLIKPYSKKGDSLNAVASGKIPQGKFFAYTPHKDSFDSRYKEIGLINEKDIIGVAIFAF
jgi:conjugal transfer pilin signal peptidase TrbI